MSRTPPHVKNNSAILALYSNLFICHALVKMVKYYDRSDYFLRAWCLNVTIWFEIVSLYLSMLFSFSWILSLLDSIRFLLLRVKYACFRIFFEGSKSYIRSSPLFKTNNCFNKYCAHRVKYDIVSQSSVNQIS